MPQSDGPSHPKSPSPASNVALVLVVGFFMLTLGWILGGKRQVVTSEADLGFGKPAFVQPGQGKSAALLSHLSADHTIADIFERVSPAVVSLDIRPRSIPGGSEDEAPWHKFDVFNSRQIESEPGTYRRTLGTGLIIRPDGYILTSSHLTRPGYDIKVLFNNKHVESAKVVGRDTFTDLALLKVDSEDLPQARFGSAKTIRPGDWAIAIGSPMGFDHSVTLGIISGLGRSLTDFSNHVELIQTDAAINPGNSGGPLLNIDGEVIGINAAIRHDAQNMGFAIPIDVAKEVAVKIMKEGTIKRPYMGMFMQDITPDMAAANHLPVTAGVVVAQVIADGPCQRAGIGVKDIILKVDGQEVKTVVEVRRHIRAHKPGEVMDFVLLRKGSEEKRKVIVGEYPE